MGRLGPTPSAVQRRDILRGAAKLLERELDEHCAAWIYDDARGKPHPPHVMQRRIKALRALIVELRKRGAEPQAPVR
jgi:acyl-CoA reductase-like NAD-dependent aldehyde dehydrogenase